MEKAYLVLSNGRVFEGTRFGADGDTVGELIFTTSVVGYIETLTDPAYSGQIILQTFPMVGNYGMIDADMESDRCHAKGYVVREWCATPSNFRSQGDIDAYLKAQGVVGLCGVDTRELTRIIRENGTMTATICSQPPADAAALVAEVPGVMQVTCRQSKVYPAVGECKKQVALIDYGVKNSLINALCAKGCQVTVYPADAETEALLATKPQGIVLSGGPGDPTANAPQIKTIEALAGKAPILAVGLGHQMLALAMGAGVEKLKYGHHGGNQPVKDLAVGTTAVTTQNHNYVVASGSLPEGAEQRYVNVNDQTCEGVAYKNICALSVQYDPTADVLDQFLKNMEG